MRDYLIKNKRFVLKYSVYIIIFVFIAAIVVNLIAKTDLGFNVSQNSTWISFYATIIAAIFGGVISGGLTLLGVIHTINSQDKKERRNQLPKKMMEAEKLNGLMLDILKSYEVHNQLDESKAFIPKRSVNRIRELTSSCMEFKQKYLEDAAKVNFEFYDCVYSMFERIIRIDRIINSDKIYIYVDEEYQDAEFIHDYKGYDPSIYENIENELKVMRRFKTDLNSEVLKLRDEYIDLSN
ncbi:MULTISPECIES: hypothetical protein [Lysinibacillus]|uniref:Phage abortive infection protein n=1 Tax=Lysinibacillus capsici TaxID=2115968 RepID=A0ABY8KMN9_9BACI|nr:hypothetical protein [Lysinibacillus capsici]WGF39798.1 hypothetical protein QBO96_05910 [Lysinibacillus capsici]